MFHVPRHAGGHPRLTLALIAATVLGAAVATGVASSRPVNPPPADEARRPVARPPLQVVEALPELTEALDRVSRGPRGFSGAVLVARGDRVLFRQVYGMADHEADRPLALDSRFRLASVSKQYTAAAILKLQDAGVLSVDDPLCQWIQPCPEAWAPIRLTHLLSHTSGVPDLMARPAWGLQRVTPATSAALTEDSKRYRLQFPPGSKVRYDNAGYNLLGAVVERASGVSLATYLQRTFFTPLGMMDTGSDADGKARDLVTGYAHFPGGLTPQNDANVSIVFAAGALYSTLDDMLVWERALHHGRVVSARSYAQMTADHAPATTPKERGRVRRDWGFGLFANSLGRQVRPAFDDRQIYHTGSWSGFRNLVTYQPEADVTVIVLSNNYHQRDQVFLIAEQAMAEALGRSFPTTLAR
ncbi:serine hydrolase domain-containing protein [Brevundimonas sp.]|uniref:serine hydrolase domain-containing protein n=1 Tax=Brevundimonas sp. TaxID=1871086 RepID=UPI0024882A80|nr:serine hydrolase domain-containing protein [Brevundimonas sp.]MDI1280818.1 serine hydrolase [Brevundimonas sp.]